MTPIIPDGIVETGRSGPAGFAGELRCAPASHELGTALLLAGDRVRVFENVGTAMLRFVTVEPPGDAAS